MKMLIYLIKITICLYIHLLNTKESITELAISIYLFNISFQFGKYIGYFIIFIPDEDKCYEEKYYWKPCIWIRDLASLEGRSYYLQKSQHPLQMRFPSSAAVLIEKDKNDKKTREQMELETK